MKTYFGADAALVVELAAATRLALYSAAPTVLGGGTELAGDGYARIPVVWAAPSNGVAVNSTALDFPPATAIWSPIVAVGLLDVSGNIYRLQTLGTPITVSTGQHIRIPAGALAVTET